MTAWTVAVAVKPLVTAKSRLARHLPTGDRRDLVVAMVQDVARAALAARSVGRVLGVTADPQAAAALTAEGAVVIVERRVAGLNAAYRLARDRVGAAPLALLMADLPALTPDALDRALDLVPARRAAVVGDVEGGGTTMLAAHDARLLVPRFGPHSRRRHECGGAVDITASCSRSLREDVDTWPALADLSVAGRAGRMTAIWLTTRQAGVA